MPVKPFSLSGGGGPACTVGYWNGSTNLLDGGGKNGGAGGDPNGGLGGWEPNYGGRGGDGGGDKLKLSSSSFGSGLFLIFFWWQNPLLVALVLFLISSLAMSFFPASSSFSSDLTIGFLASNVEISSKTSSSGFCVLKIFLLIGSNFCLKLALLILSFFTYWLMPVCMPFSKSLVARIYLSVVRRLVHNC